MSELQPVWRQGFDAVERAVAPRVEELVNSEGFAVVVGLISQARKAVQRRVERDTHRWLHLVNLPAGSDVTRVLAEIGQLQKQVRDLTREINATKAKEASTNGGSRANGRPARPAAPRR